MKAKLNSDIVIASIDDNFPTTNDFVSGSNLTDSLKIGMHLLGASITSIQPAAIFFSRVVISFFMYVQIASSGVSISRETQIVLAPLGLINLLFSLLKKMKISNIGNKYCGSRFISQVRENRLAISKGGVSFACGL